MSYIKITFDLKKFARAMRNRPGDADSGPNPDMPSPDDLPSCLKPVYVQALREERITITDLDFSRIGEGDIDGLEYVLTYSPANRLFDICEAFKGFKPSAAEKRVFI